MSTLLMPDKRLLGLDGEELKSRTTKAPRLPDFEGSAFMSGHLLRAFERGELTDARPDDLPLFRADVVRWMHPAVPDFWTAYRAADLHAYVIVQDAAAEALDRMGALETVTHETVHRRRVLRAKSSHAALSMAMIGHELARVSAQDVTMAGAR